MGKTTIARPLSDDSNLAFEPVSATFSGMADLRKVFAAARSRRTIGQGTLLFVDEIHRFNRAQQDSFSPYVDEGTITLVCATTENPSLELNGALLSGTQVLVLKRLDEAALSTLLDRAEHRTGDRPPPLDDDARPALVHHTQQRALHHDKAHEGHYNLISALHKSMRGSDPDAALYCLARMLDGGEDPCSWPADWSVSRTKTSASPTRTPSSRPSPLGTCTSDSAPRGRVGDRPRSRLPRHGFQVHRRLQRLQRGPPLRPPHRLTHAARPHPNADENLIRTRAWWLELSEPHHPRAAVAVVWNALHGAYSFEISVA